MSRMAIQTKRFSRTVARWIAVGIVLLILAILLQPVLFPRAARVRAWSADAGVAFDGRMDLPTFEDGKVDARPLLVIESPPMDRRNQARRQKQLYSKLAKARIGPLHLGITDLPEASLVQKAVVASKLPPRCIVVLEISLLDLIREDRGIWGGRPLPQVGTRDGRIQILPDPGKPPVSTSRSDVLETRTGSFPASLWPLRRNGAPQESKRYERLTQALRLWKQEITALQGELVVLYLPIPIECNPKQLASELEILGLDSSQLQSSRAGRRLQDLCTELDLPFIDPTRLLASASRKKRPLFEGITGLPFEARYTERAENLILGRLTDHGIKPIFR